MTNNLSLQRLKHLWYFFSVVFLLCGIDVQSAELSLTGNWLFRKAGTTQWYPARVPGNVYQDLLLAGQIEHPYKNQNETKYAFIDTVGWEYRCELPEVINQYQNPELVFEGLDTYASIYLNDQLIGKTDNMFRTWHFDSIPIVKGKNILQIKFDPALPETRKIQEKHPIQYPGGSRMFCRKAAFQFGWDWAPALEGCGIRLPVIIRDSPNDQLMYPKITTLQLNDSIALLNYRFVVHAKKAGQLEVIINCPELDFKIEIPVKTRTGSNAFDGTFQVKNPILWFPNEQGSQKLYPFLFDLLNENKKTIQHTTINYGISNIELDQSPDGTGRNFRFKVNGKIIFAKGANFVPVDMLHPYEIKNLIGILNQAKQNHFNMIRVWGGGIYPPDRFYEICDSLGLMVWQDFMFANGMIPYLSLKENILAELREQILRIRHHTCIALWCGNNEILEGWNNWGWQKEYAINKADSIALFNEYTALFNQAIPSLLKREDPSRSYWPGSPGMGWGRPQAYEMGDVHYWGVWWGMHPFESYRVKTGRFSSEFGFQGLPVSTSLKSMLEKKVKRNYRETLRYFQRHPRGFETMDAYRANYFLKTNTFENDCYTNALTQALGIEMALESHQYNRPHCMGSLYWQLNDAWPCISWSGIDYYGANKPMQYRIRELYRNLVPVIQLSQDRIKLKICNDSSNVDVKVILTCYDMNGRVLMQVEKDLQLPEHRDSLVLDMSRTALNFEPADSTTRFLVSRIVIDGHEYSIRTSFGCRPKFLQVADAQVKIETAEEGKFWRYTLSSEVPAFYLHLNSEDGRNFSDNGFHLYPFERKTIYLPKHEQDKKAPTPSFIHLHSSYN